MNTPARTPRGELLIEMPTIRVTPDSQVRAGITDINTWWGKLAEHVAQTSIRIGQSLIRMQDNCKAAGINFGDLFAKNAQDRGPGKLPFSWATGNKLMSIAQNAALSDSSHARNCLPTDWTSLYELSRVEPKRLTQLIDEGKVQPDMGRPAIKRLVNETRPAKTTKKKAAKCEDVSRSRAIDPRRVVENIVNDLSGTMLTLSMFNINLSSINASKAELDHWTAELTAGIAGLRKLNVELNRLAAAAALQERGQ